MPIINENLVQRANDNSFFRRGDGLERDAQSESNSFRANFASLEKKLGGFNEKQQEILNEREADWRSLVAAQYNDMAIFEANNVSWVVAGPANYNAKRYNKKLDAAMNRFTEKDEKKKRFIKNTEDMLMKAMSAEEQVAYWRMGRNGHGEAIASDDPLAVEKMEAHIERLKELHVLHVKWNSSIRSNKGASQCEGMSDRMKAEIDASIKRNPYFANQYFFTDSETADIRNKTRRLESLKKARELASQQAENGTSPEMHTEGLRLVIDHAIARVQLVFDGKPDDETRAKLKANGFRWSPRNGAWQRQNTVGGVLAAKRLFKEIANEA